MSTDPNPPIPPPATPLVQIGPMDGSMGLTGLWRNVANASAATILGFAFLYGGHYVLQQNREDRTYDRQMFRESLQSIQSEDNRRAGEIKGSMDAANTATRELTAEIRSWRHAAHESKTKGGPP